MKTISSLQNDSIKFITGLIRKASLRKESNVFVVEGKRELQLVVRGGFGIEKLFCCQEIFKYPKIEEWCTQNLGISNMVRVTENVYRKISYRKKTEGIVALVKKKKMGIDSIVFKNKNPLVLVAENIEKPGNIGAMLRTADASKIDCLLIAEPQTDMYNPNVIRSSVGGFFSVPIGVGTNEEVHTFLNQHHITPHAARLEASVSYETIDFTKPSAVVVGAESTGLSKFWLNASKSNIKIPMLGTLDSMNVSVAAGILLFEATRQRNFYRDQGI
ncbi:MAG: RNA methyltransferase [Bacteroidota bacterium]|nr:RNA methyltransferase [Bacteroidota bacterium]